MVSNLERVDRIMLIYCAVEASPRFVNCGTFTVEH